jgi:hypothetical protein
MKHVLAERNLSYSLWDMFRTSWMWRIDVIDCLSYMYGQ